MNKTISHILMNEPYNLLHSNEWTIQSLIFWWMHHKISYIIMNELNNLVYSDE